MLYGGGLIYGSVDEILKGDNSNGGAVCYAVHNDSHFRSLDTILKCGHSNESCRAVYFLVML